MKFNNFIPFEEIYQSSLKEASRKKPVFFIHKYFARRITSNFRMSILDYIHDDNKLLEHFYESSRNKGKGITILDPFMGGGTTILEALRFGCNVVGNDLQPLSYFVTKALVEDIDKTTINNQLQLLEKTVGEKIKSLYSTTCPQCEQKADIMYVFHVKKAATSCNNMSHRFFSSFVIALKKDEFTIVCPKCGQLHKTKFENGNFSCDCGWTMSSLHEKYVNKGVFSCPNCNESHTLTDYVGDGSYPFDTDIIAIEYYCPHCKSHDYKAPDQNDFKLYKDSCIEYENIKDSLPIPQQEIPQGYNTNQILNHGYKQFKDLFNKRQLYALGILLDAINKIEDTNIQFWFQLAFSGMLEMNNMFCRYQQNAYKISNIFFNHAYVPISMPVENCVWGTKLGTGTFIKTLNKILRGKAFNEKMYDLKVKAKSFGGFESVKVFNGDTVSAECVDSWDKLSAHNPLLLCSDSRTLEGIPDNSIDIVLTDPPYGANVMYSELIDFFHSWNFMSSHSNEFGFKTPLSPKQEEIIVNDVVGKDYLYYQNGITAVFKNCYTKLKSNGFLIFSFHDKSIDSWLSVLTSISAAEFSIVKTYPVQAETRTGAHTSGKNSIGIDMMLICAKNDISKEKSCVTVNEIELAIKQTISETGDYIDRFKNVDAEMTLPDIENIAIALLFKNCSNMKIYENCIDPILINKTKEFLSKLESKIENLDTVKIRTGWWSKLFADKWNI